MAHGRRLCFVASQMVFYISLYRDLKNHCFPAFRFAEPGTILLEPVCFPDFIASSICLALISESCGGSE